MPRRVILFDLFDTLVDLELPRFAARSAGGRPVHATAERLHAVLTGRDGGDGRGGRAELPFEAFAEGLREIDRTLMVPRHRAGREFPTLERFEALARHLGLADPELPARLTAAHMGALAEHARPVAHHREVLRALRERARLAVCSNFTHADTARAILRDAGLADLFDAVVISEDVGFRKPRAEIFRAALERLGADPAAALHVGDNLEADVAGAAALGLRTAWLTRRVRDPAAALRAHTGPPPDLTLADLSELAARLEDDPAA